MKIENFIARRYIFAKHRLNFITIISYLSIGGITLGVAALILVLAVFNGFGNLVKEFLLDFDPHIRIEVKDEAAFPLLPAIDSTLKHNNHVISYSPMVTGKVLLLKNEYHRVVLLKGIDPEKAKDTYKISSNMVLGDFTFREQESIPGIILGIGLADRLQAVTGDTVTIVSPIGIEKAIASVSLPRMQKFVVTGIFSANNNEYDANYMFSNLAVSSYLLGYGSNFQGFEVRLKDIEYSNQVKAELESQLDPELFTVNTWYDFHKELYTVMQVERWTAYLILSLIIAVATFNILASLTMSVIEKKRDIGILQSMGMESKSVLKIFLYEGLFIGILGTSAGFVLGYLIYFLQKTFNLYPLNPAQYRIDSLPMDIQFTDFLAVGAVSMLLSLLAAWYPAKRAAKTDPLEAIRWE